MWNMRVIEANDYGGPEVLVESTRPDPAPTPGRIRVRVAAATVNPADAGTRAGAFAHFVPDLPKPFVLGWDFSGTVIEDAEGFRSGERVAGIFPWFELGNGDGASAEIVSAEPEWLARVPSELGDVEAATIPLNALTARQAVDLLAAKPGDVVVVTGASGAVGGFAVQFLVAEGAHVVAVASAGDEEYVATLGAKDIVTRSPGADLPATIHGGAPDGVDAVFDPGAAGDSLLSVVRDGGTFVAAAGAPPAPERGIRVERVGVTPNATQLQTILNDAGAGRLSTRVAAQVPFADAADAHRRLEAGGFQGKLVLVTGV
jgi:NADPH:quinone reductase-like Zn-dependent oxidoreductase